MRTLFRLHLPLLLFVCSGLAHPAADPNIVTTVVAVPEQVTLSRPTGKNGGELVTFAAYRVGMANNTTNALNRVFFQATAVNVANSEPVVFDSTVPAAANCTGLGTSTLNCSFGSLAPGSATADLHIVVRAPLSGTRIDVNWVAGGDEGNGGGNGCCNQSGTTSTALADPTTDTSYRRRMTSFVKPEGGLFFTGDAAVTTSADGWSTSVLVPNLASLPQSTVTIVETPRAESCAPYAVAGGCFATDLTIPGSFASLQISFRWDKSLFNLGRNQTANLYYTGSAIGIVYPITLQLCTVDAVTYGSAPSSGRPCLVEPPRKLSNQDTPIKDLWGDLLFRVLALDNGFYTN